MGNGCIFLEYANATNRTLCNNTKKWEIISIYTTRSATEQSQWASIVGQALRTPLNERGFAKKSRVQDTP